MAPDWEDDANKAGGRWVARREHRQVDDAWLNLLLFLIGEHADMRDELVTGAVVSVRKAGDRLALWISEADNLETVVKVRFQKFFMQYYMTDLCHNQKYRWCSL